MTDDFFHNCLSQLIDLRHPLAASANRMLCQEIDASLTLGWASPIMPGKKIEQLDLFCAVDCVTTGSLSHAGQPLLPTRLIAAPLYLKHAFSESVGDVTQHWSSTPTWQCFSADEHCEHRWPRNPTELGRFRKLLGEEDMEKFLVRIMEVTVTLELINHNELRRLIFDSTAQQQAVAHPNDRKMRKSTRDKLVEADQAHGGELRQIFANEGRQLRFKAGRYVHARQIRHLCKLINRWRTILCKLQREVSRRLTAQTQTTQQTRGYTQDNVNQLVRQTASRRTMDKLCKLYSRHAPEPRRTSEGKSRSPYEFGMVVDHDMQRYQVKGSVEDALHSALCAADYNTRWLLRMIAKKNPVLCCGRLRRQAR